MQNGNHQNQVIIFKPIKHNVMPCSVSTKLSGKVSANRPDQRVIKKVLESPLDCVRINSFLTVAITGPGI